MPAASPLPVAERERLLALIGVERWVLRGSEPAASEPSGSDHPGCDHVDERSRPGPLPQAKLAILTGETDPLSGRHAALLRHVLRALALDDTAVAWSRSEGAPVLAFGSGDATDTVLAPPLATLRASGAARRSLWPALRALRRKLRESR